MIFPYTCRITTPERARWWSIGDSGQDRKRIDGGLVILWHLIPRAAIQHATGAPLERAAPLLEEEWHASDERA